ncbi:PTS sugar transporter subunit IIA [Priestia megaterium]|nr:PTS sugar transporter subunit IIA [Priestia megaterium]
MLETYLTEDKIQMTSQSLDWEEAIKRAATPLLTNGSIKGSYVNQMIQNVHTMGPYIVIAPNIAFAHARPEDGVQQTDISLLVSESPVSFSAKPEHQCQLIFVFAAADSESHLQLLSALSVFLSDEEQVKRLIQAKSVQELVQVIQS